MLGVGGCCEGAVWGGVGGVGCAAAGAQADAQDIQRCVWVCVCGGVLGCVGVGWGGVGGGGCRCGTLIQDIQDVCGCVCGGVCVWVCVGVCGGGVGRGGGTGWWGLQVRTLIQDIQDVRQSKIENGLKKLSAATHSCEGGTWNSTHLAHSYHTVQCSTLYKTNASPTWVEGQSVSVLSLPRFSLSLSSLPYSCLTPCACVSACLVYTCVCVSVCRSVIPSSPTWRAGGSLLSVPGYLLLSCRWSPSLVTRTRMQILCVRPCPVRVCACVRVCVPLPLPSSPTFLRWEVTLVRPFLCKSLAHLQKLDKATSSQSTGTGTESESLPTL